MDIFEELDRTRAALLDIIDGLDEDTLERKGAVGEWSVKNVLAHMAAWEAWVVQALPARLDTGETPAALRARIADEDRYNAEEIGEREELTASEQLIELERTRTALLDELRRLDAATWERRRPWSTWEGTLAEYLRESIVGHEQEHIDGLRAVAEQVKLMSHIPQPDDRISPAPHDMDPDEFRRYGRQVIDWIAGYLDEVDRYPVVSAVQPGEIRAQLPPAPPDGPEPIAQILHDFEQVIVPGITHWNHPSFFAYFAISGSAPGILGELLAAALNVNGMLWKTSPSATELEELTLDWLRQMLGLPAEFRGVIMDTASIASMVAIAAARESLGLDIRRKGMAGRPDLPTLRVYTSEQAHSSIEKGAITLGVGQENVRKIPTDAAFRMDPRALAQAIDADIAAGWRPFCVAATVGTTSTTSVDPVPEIAAICRERGLWLHVDGAYGGIAAIVPEFRHVLNGCEYADSLVVNPHKWLFTPIDCSAFYVRDPDVLKRAFSLVPEYLKTHEDDANNYMDWGVQLGRRFRALKLWMVIRAFGRDGLADRIREHIRMSQGMAAWVDADPDFERLAPTPFSTVCFRARPHDLAARLESAHADENSQIESYLDRLNEAVVDAINSSGKAFFSHTKLNGRYTIRMAIGNIRTSPAHVERAWQLVHAEAQRLDAELRVPSMR